MTDQKLLPVQSFPYLTVAPDRRPQQKVHKNIGQAKNAISYRASMTYKRALPKDCQIYEWKNDKWTLLWDIPAGTRVDDMPWNKKTPVEKIKPVRQPWHDAKMGEVWAVSHDNGDQYAYRVIRKFGVSTFEFVDGETNFPVTDSDITSARRIWPEK